MLKKLMKSNYLKIGRLNPLIFTLLLVFSINWLTAPSSFYEGDSGAIKYSAINLVQNGSFGIDQSNKSEIDGFLKNKGQYFHLNMRDGKYYQRWGFFLTVIFAIPEFFVSHFSGPSIEPTKDTLLYHNFFNIFLSLVLALFLYKTARLYSSHRWFPLLFVGLIFYSTFTFNYLRAQSYELLQLVFYSGFMLFFLLNMRKPHWQKNVTSLFFLSCLVLTKDFFIIAFLVVLIIQWKEIGFNWRLNQSNDLIRSICCLLLLVVGLLLANKWQYNVPSEHP